MGKILALAEKGTIVEEGCGELTSYYALGR